MDKKEQVAKLLDEFSEEYKDEYLKDLANQIDQIYNQPDPEIPEIVCLCGSTRFSEAFRKANFDLTLAGKIVLTIGCDTRSDAELFAQYPAIDFTEIKIKLDELHKRKIDIANSLLILNVGGYIGESTRSEIDYAKAHDKIIRYLEPVLETKLY